MRKSTTEEISEKSLKELDPKSLADEIVNLLSKQPLSLQQLSDHLKVPLNLIKPLINALIHDGVLKASGKRLNRFTVVYLPPTDEDRTVAGFVCSRCGWRANDFPEVGICPRCGNDFFWTS